VIERGDCVFRMGRMMRYYWCFSTIFLLVVLLLIPCVFSVDFAKFETRMVYQVSDYGANGADAQKDTHGFQNAVDACFNNGGGIVQVPPGVYYLGRVILKDRVAINLAAGAVIHPSTDPADFPPLAGSPESNYKPELSQNALNSRFAIFYALNASDIAIEGFGKIVGDGRSFWTVKNTGNFTPWNTVATWFYYKPNDFRPILLLFEDCQNITIRDIALEDSPCYSGWFAGCRSVSIAHTKIRNDLAGPNTDGYHFSSCRNVHITDCDFVCGDDCIAVDPNHNGPSANITVSGCAFNTTVNVFRIYTGLDPGISETIPWGQVSDISATNCSVENSSGVFNVTAERGAIQRLTFSNFTIHMDLRGSAFFFLTLHGGKIEDVLLANMAIQTDGLGTLLGDGGGLIRGIMLDGLRYDVFPRAKLYGNGYPDPLTNYGLHHFAPYNFFFRHAQDVIIHNVQVEWKDACLEDLDKIEGGKPQWSCLDCRDVSGLGVEGLAAAPFGSGAPFVHLDRVKDASFSQCRAVEKIDVFLEVSGDSDNINLANNDFSKVATIYKIADGLSSSILRESGNRKSESR
jgi:hypothetical protein